MKFVYTKMKFVYSNKKYSTHQACVLINIGNSVISLFID